MLLRIPASVPREPEPRFTFDFDIDIDIDIDIEGGRTFGLTQFLYSLRDYVQDEVVGRFEPFFPAG